MPARILGNGIALGPHCRPGTGRRHRPDCGYEGYYHPCQRRYRLAALDKAEAEDVRALMLLLDTPGGGLAETTEILRLIDQIRRFRSSAMSIQREQ